jgi:hypothetical protein
MNIPYDSFPSDLDRLDKNAKSRAARYNAGKIGTRAFLNGILRDLENCARGGKIHAYAILVKMYDETIVEAFGQGQLEAMMRRAVAGWRRYKEQGAFTPFIPF